MLDDRDVFISDDEAHFEEFKASLNRTHRLIRLVMVSAAAGWILSVTVVTSILVWRHW